MNRRLIHDAAWAATGKLLEMVNTATPEERGQFFHAVYQVVVDAIVDYEEKAERMQRRLNGAYHTNGLQK